MADSSPSRTPRSNPPARWALVQDDLVFVVGSQAIYLGRSPDCEIVLEDPSVSRRHASVHLGPTGPVIVDGGSRHGTLVNGRRIEGPTALAHGDGIVVGGIRFLVQDLARRGREAQPTLRLRAAERTRATSRTIRDVPVTGEHDPLAALVSEIEIVADSGEGGRATNLVAALLKVCADRASSGRLDEGSLRRAAAAILRAATPEDSAWIDGVVQLHQSARRLMHASTLDHLETSLRRVRHVDLAALVVYAAWLGDAGVADGRGEYGAYCLRRLEDIVRSDLRPQPPR